MGQESGNCVFSLACTFSGGRHLGICRDRFYFGSCCQISRNFEGDQEKEDEEESNSNNNSVVDSNTVNDGDLDLDIVEAGGDEEVDDPTGHGGKENVEGNPIDEGEGT